MQSYQALYYPFIHFRDDNWLKLAALYWDKVARIGLLNGDEPQGLDLEQAARAAWRHDSLGRLGHPLVLRVSAWPGTRGGVEWLSKK